MILPSTIRRTIEFIRDSAGLPLLLISVNQQENIIENE